ncbi:hypothetical protein [Saccharothrix coeruleofusca]|uniref:Uncharacterized protein n=1 Tax=Saccharothrix coeruleofusca TaxID=33919 RepID=A0A918ALQ2_9PSEU|nr:hypothetical protein [Saccharothrix coeruleofusca]MBP2334104.1 hypothetical protein [Saccharothrix coeruleofusca]GGP43403.1 hypothetical protein GCM10010185_13770 [Saccharothrix coeruleofusca]
MPASFPPTPLVKRCWCTGETQNTVRRRGSATGPLVPSAATGAQRRFEAALLTAVHRAMARMRRRRVAVRPTALIGCVQLDERVLGLRVHDAALDHLLAEALPSLAGGELLGVPGLRAHPGRDHLDLRAPGGEVRLLGVSRQRWRQARTAGLPPGPGEQLHPLERRALRAQAALPAELMSGVLRRLPLWRGAAWLDGVVVGDTVELYWRGGPPDDSVAAILADSSCGIPGTVALPHGVHDAIRGVVLSAVPEVPHRPEPEWAWTKWLAGTAPGPALTEHAVLAREVDLPDVWEQPAVRQALAHRDISSVYRVLVRHGVPPARIAALTGQPEVEVLDVVAGKAVEVYDTLVGIARGLGVPLGYMGLAHDEPVPAPTTCECALLDERDKRERFLAHAALISIGSAAVDSSRWGCRSRSCRTAPLSDAAILM